MSYAKIENGVVVEFALTLDIIRKRFPNTSFPNNASGENLPNGYVGYLDSIEPVYDMSTQKLVENTPLFNGVDYIQNWDIENLNSDELAEVARIKLENAKSLRAELVEAIVVTSNLGRVFNGDEKSQDRIARMISVLGDADQRMWVLADNTVVYDVTKAELKDVLTKSLIAMSEVWAGPYL